MYVDLSEHLKMPPLTLTDKCQISVLMTLYSSSRKNKTHIPNQTKKSTTLSQVQNPRVKDGNFTLEIQHASNNFYFWKYRFNSLYKFLQALIKYHAFFRPFFINIIDVLCFCKTYCPPHPKAVYLMQFFQSSN